MTRLPHLPHLHLSPPSSFPTSSLDVEEPQWFLLLPAALTFLRVPHPQRIPCPAPNVRRAAHCLIPAPTTHPSVGVRHLARKQRLKQRWELVGSCFQFSSSPVSSNPIRPTFWSRSGPLDRRHDPPDQKRTRQKDDRPKKKQEGHDKQSCQMTDCDN